MVTKIRVPKLGMAQEDISVVEWLIKDKGKVEKGQPIVSIETAKTSFMVEAEETGIVTILKDEGELVSIGDELGIISDNLEEIEEIEKSVITESEENRIHDESDSNGDKSKGIKEIIPIIGIRKTIADNLMNTVKKTASQTIVAEADLTELKKYITQLQENDNMLKIKINSAFIRLVVKVLEEYPIFNSIEEENKIIIYKKYNIGMAVMSGGYLKVPVIRDVEKKDLLEINAEIIRIIDRANKNELMEEDFQDGTFTFSNAGKNEVDIVTPIINPPQKAIIAVGRIAFKPCVYNGKIESRLMTSLCLTFDHRIIDGAVAGLFISRLKEIIQSKELIKEVLS